MKKEKEERRKKRRWSKEMNDGRLKLDEW